MRANFPKRHSIFIPKQFRPHITQSSHHSNSSHNTWETSGSDKLLPPPTTTPVPPLKPINQEYETDSKESLVFESNSKSKVNSPYVAHMAIEFLAEMQELDYVDSQPEKLMEEFKDIVCGHITFAGVYP
jgi:hypothetical protein